MQLRWRVTWLCNMVGESLDIRVLELQNGILAVDHVSILAVSLWQDF
jgi:hypothetical protein